MDTFVNNSPELNAAIKSYLRAHQMPTTVSVAVEKAAPGYIRARVTLTTAQADPAFAFLREEGDAYRVLGFGTYFDAEFYKKEGIPANLRL